jgi:hypothetical protein
MQVRLPILSSKNVLSKIKPTPQKKSVLLLPDKNASWLSKT